MKVLVANPPAYLWNDKRRYIQGGSRWSHSMMMSKEEVTSRRSQGFFPYTPYPFFLGYAASYISDIADVKFIDGVVMNYDQDDFLKHVLKLEPDLLVMETPTVSIELDMRLIGIIKEKLNLKVAVTGIHASSQYSELLRTYKQIDFVLVNEYELTLHELIEKDLVGEEIKGLAFRKGDQIKFNGPRAVLKDISSLPFPYRDRYVAFYDDFTIKGRPNIQMITSRGCPVGCNFCYTTVFYENPIYRYRNVDEIIDEINFVISEFRPKQLYFDDDTITINPKHISDMAKAMIKENIDIPWTCMGDITVKRENLQIMKKAGCVGMKFGVESSNPETLKLMHKGIVSADKTFRFRQMLREEGLWAHATFSLGHPGDDPQAIVGTLEFAKKLRPNSLQVSIATPIPGTSFYEDAKRNDWLISSNWNDFDGNKGTVLNYPNLSHDEIDRLRKEFEIFWDEEKLKFPTRIKNIYFKKDEIINRKLGKYPRLEKVDLD